MFKSINFVVLIVLAAVVLSCNGEYMDFRFIRPGVVPRPTRVSWQNVGDKTHFSVDSYADDTSNYWISFGFGTSESRTNLITCLSKVGIEKPVRQHYHPFSATNALADDNWSIGISNVVVKIVDSTNFVCNFTRDNTFPNAKYFNITATTTTKLIAAYGPLSATGTELSHTSNRVSTVIDHTFLLPTTPSSDQTQPITASTTTTLNPDDGKTVDVTVTTPANGAVGMNSQTFIIGTIVMMIAKQLYF